MDSPSNGSTSLDILEKHATGATASTTDDGDANSQGNNPGEVESTTGTGSPPMTTTGSKAAGTGSTHNEYFISRDNNASPPPLPHAIGHPPPNAEPKQAPTSHPNTTQTIAKTQQTQRGGSRVISKGGGAQVTLDETGSWSDLAHRESVTNGGEEGRQGSAGGIGSSSGSGKSKANGMLGFLSRRRGRDRSPKPMEAGVLGKEGARVVVGDR